MAINGIFNIKPINIVLFLAIFETKKIRIHWNKNSRKTRLETKKDDKKILFNNETENESRNPPTKSNKDKMNSKPRRHL